MITTCGALAGGHGGTGQCTSPSAFLNKKRLPRIAFTPHHQVQKWPVSL
jgi:hypothetical protein